MKYLGMTPLKPKIAVFDFTGCEGCELQLANKEDTLAPFLDAVEIVNFREVTTVRRDDYDIAFIEGCISRGDEIERLKAIRSTAKVLVALGSCACFGGVNRMKNVLDLQEANREVYDKEFKETLYVRSAKEIVKVDMEIPGCPVSKAEVERIVQHIVWNVSFDFPKYPVCLECKQRYSICRFDFGELCLGPVTRGGCGAPCPAGGLGCWGCRGPAAEPNYEEFFALAGRKGFGKAEISERMNFFGGFEGVLK